jgi:hypothetical protein
MMTKSMMRPLALISFATAVVMASGVNHDFYALDDNTTDTNMTTPLQTLEMRVDNDNKDIDSAIPLDTLEMRLRANDGQKKTKRIKDNGRGSGNMKKKAGNVNKKNNTGSGGGRKKTRAGDVTTKEKSDKLPNADVPNLRDKDKRTSATNEGKKAKVDATAIMKDTDKRTSEVVRDEGRKEDKKPRSSAAAIQNDSEKADKKGTNKVTADGSKMTGKLDRFGQTLEREKEKNASPAEPIKVKVDASSVMSNKGGAGGGKDMKMEQSNWKSPSKPTDWSHSEDTQ